MRNRLEAVEIVVVDDSSTDDTLRVAGMAASRSPVPVSCLRLERRSGPAAARNEGMRVASSRHVLFLDADIVLPGHAIEALRAAFARYEARPEIRGVMGVYSESIPWRDFLSDYKNLHVCYLHKSTETISPYLHTPILCIDRKILEDEGGFDTGLATAEDFRMGVKLGSKGYRFVLDRSIQGTHLKRYSFRSLIREDWRRVRDLLSIQLEEDQQKFLYRAHRWTRLLSAALPFPALAATVLVAWHPGWAALAALFWLAFFACNLPLLRYMHERRGLWFSLKAAGLLFLEMLCAQAALIYWSAVRFMSAVKSHHKDTKTPRSTIHDDINRGLF